MCNFKGIMNYTEFATSIIPKLLETEKDLYKHEIELLSEQCKTEPDLYPKKNGFTSIIRVYILHRI